MNGLLLDADGCRIAVRPLVVPGSRVTITGTLDPASTPDEFDVQERSMLGSEPTGDVHDPELDADPALVLASSLGFAMDEIATLADAVAEIDDVLVSDSE